MTWDPGVSSEIADMFDEYSWRGEDVRQALEERRAYALAKIAARSARYRDTPERRKRAVEVARQWRIDNRERARELSRAQGRRDRQRAKVDPEFAARLRERRKAYLRRRYERDPEAVRAIWRRRRNAYLARKRAAAKAGAS